MICRVTIGEPSAAPSASMRVADSPAAISAPVPVIAGFTAAAP